MICKYPSSLKAARIARFIVANLVPTLKRNTNIAQASSQRRHVLQLLDCRYHYYEILWKPRNYNVYNWVKRAFLPWQSQALRFISAIMTSTTMNFLSNAHDCSGHFWRLSVVTGKRLFCSNSCPELAEIGTSCPCAQEQLGSSNMQNWQIELPQSQPRKDSFESLQMIKMPIYTNVTE